MAPSIRQHPPLTLAAVILLAMPGSARAASALAYVRASSQLEQASSPQRFQPLNLLDHDPTTVWCEGSQNGGTGQEVRVVFTSPQRVDQVRIVAAAKGGRAILQLRISDGQHSVRVPVDVNETGASALSTPLQGTEFVVTIERVADRRDAGSSPAACLAEVEFFNGTQALVTGPQGQTAATQVVGSWAAAPLGAPENTLSFNLDGTWHWQHTPLLGGAQRHLRGTYRLHGGHLQMRLGSSGRWVAMNMQVERVTIDQEDLGAPRGDYDSLSLGNGLGPDLAASYNNAQF